VSVMPGSRHLICCCAIAGILACEPALVSAQPSGTSESDDLIGGATPERFLFYSGFDLWTFGYAAMPARNGHQTSRIGTASFSALSSPTASSVSIRRRRATGPRSFARRSFPAGASSAATSK
jgi:hypothetical protein